MRSPEEMDDPRLCANAHHHALRSLAFTNHLLGVDNSVRRALNRAAPAHSSVLDLGCGGGALLSSLDSARSRKFLVGVDRSEFALKSADNINPLVAWIVADVRRIPLAADSVDVVVCTLLMHHFDPDDAVAVLAEAARVARCAVVISDLTRSRMAWLLTWASTRLLSRSWVFHLDGPRSVRAAYVCAEMHTLARRAGLKSAIITRQFPFRMLLVWLKPASATGICHGL